MTAHLKIDFVSDIACPWCIIGLRALEEALTRPADAVDAEIAFQPFELNPTMPVGGRTSASISRRNMDRRASSPPQTGR